MLLAALLTIVMAVANVATLPTAYQTYLDGRRTPLAACEWLRILQVDAWSSAAQIAVGVLALVAVAVFVFPPHVAARQRSPEPNSA